MLQAAGILVHHRIAGDDAFSWWFSVVSIIAMGILFFYLKNRWLNLRRRDRTARKAARDYYRDN